jgi:hypothetical protein
MFLRSLDSLATRSCLMTSVIAAQTPITAAASIITLPERSGAKSVYEGIVGWIGVRWINGIAERNR